MAAKCEQAAAAFVEDGVAEEISKVVSHSSYPARLCWRKRRILVDVVGDGLLQHLAPTEFSKHNQASDW